MPWACTSRWSTKLWTTHVDDHASAGVTGSPVAHDGRLFVGVQGLSEEGRGSTGGYPCCTFRGSLVALDVSTGQQLWKTYTIDETAPRGKNKDGVSVCPGSAYIRSRLTRSK